MLFFKRNNIAKQILNNNLNCNIYSKLLEQLHNELLEFNIKPPYNIISNGSGYILSLFFIKNNINSIKNCLFINPIEINIILKEFYSSYAKSILIKYGTIFNKILPNLIEQLYLHDIKIPNDKLLKNYNCVIFKDYDNFNYNYNTHQYFLMLNSQIKYATYLSLLSDKNTIYWFNSNHDITINNYENILKILYNFLKLKIC